MRSKKRSISIHICAILLLAAAILAGSWFLFRNRGSASEGAAQYYDTMLSAGFASEDGFYHQNSTGFLYFFDYNTGQDVIVCSKPNCTHEVWYEDTPDEQRCHAYLQGALAGAGFVQENSLYLFFENLHTQTTSVVRSGLDRTGQEKITDFENTVILPFVVDGQFLYMSGSAILMEKDEDGMEYPTGENETWLFQVNLQTGTVTTLTERKRAFGSDLYIVGVYNGRIYYKESYFETMYDGTNYAEAGPQVDWYAYDTQTGQSERICEDQRFQEAYLYENKLISLFGKDAGSGEERYAQIEIAVCDMDAGESRPVVTADKMSDCADGKIFYAIETEEEAGARFYDYDIEKEKTVEMERSFMENLHIRGVFGDYLLILKDDPDTGIGEFYAILKQDFYQEKENYIPITW